jgi:hypothetical protein
VLLTVLDVGRDRRDREAASSHRRVGVAIEGASSMREAEFSGCS